MKVIVHKTECQNHTFIVLLHHIDSVHSDYEIQSFKENPVNGIAVRAEVPAIAHRNLLPFSKSDVQA